MRHDNHSYQLIAGCLRDGTHSVGETTEWEQVIRVAAREDVLPWLDSHPKAPAEITDFLTGVQELNAERNSQLLREVESHAELLNRAGIEPVVLKGAAYLETGVYADPARRLVRDIDLLVDPAQSERAFELIQSTGYEPFVPNPSGLFLHHHPALTKVHAVPVEIHHRLGFGACNTLLSSAEMIGESRAVRLGAATVRVPSPEHLVCHLIAHSQMHHGSPSRIWPSLRDMHDLTLLAKRFRLDWGTIRERFRRHGQSSILDLHLLQVEKILRMPLPFEILGGPRWWYREALWSEPKLRYLDPIYLCSRMVLPKIRLTQRLLKHPVGRKYVFGTPFRPGFYKRLLTDLLQRV